MKTDGEETVLHHKWTFDEICLLTSSALNTKQDWKLVQQLYFPYLSIEQLLAKHKQLEEQRRKHIGDFVRVQKNPKYVREIDNKDLEQELTRLKVVVFKRAVIKHQEKLMLGLPSVPPEVSSDLPFTNLHHL